MDGAWFKVAHSKLEPGLFGQSAVEHNGLIYTFGGCDKQGVFYNQVHIWDTKEHVWSQAETIGAAPGPRNFHAAAVVKNSMYVHGGKSNGYHADMYRYSFAKKKWYQFTYKDKPPLARYGHSLIYCNGSLYMLGGYDQHGFCCDDLYQFSTQSHSWKKIQFISPLGAISIGRFHSSVAFYKSKILVYAGKGADSTRNDLLEYDLNNHTWKRITTNGNKSNEPGPRWGHTSHVIGDFLYIFGGRDGISHFSDLYCFDLVNQKWHHLLPNSTSGNGFIPEPRYFHSSVAIGRSIFYIAGKNIYDFNFDDMMEWRILSSSPSSSSFSEINNHTNSSNQNTSSNVQKEDGLRMSAKSQGSDSSISFASSSTFFHNIIQSSNPHNSGSGNNVNRLSGDRKIRLKCIFKDEMRMMSVSPVISFSELQDRLTTEYGESNIKIQYEDEEGDLITIRSTANMEEALMFFGDINRPSIKLLLSSSNSIMMDQKGLFNNDNITTVDQTISTSYHSNNSASSLQQQILQKSNKEIPKSPVMSSQMKIPNHNNNNNGISSPRNNNHNHNSLNSFDERGSNSSSSSFRIIRWQSGGLIGEGGFGKVYLGMNVDTAELMAVKQVPLSGESSFIDALKREISLVQDLYHPNIIRYFGSEVKDGFLNIFLEYQPGGSISSLLSKFHQFSEKVIISFTKQTLKGLEYLHANGIAHRDIKCANLLVDLNGCVKLADFGASKQLADLRSFTEGCMTVTGSPYWMAPEVIQGNTGKKSYGRKADIWSLGATVIEMVTGKPPFSNLAPVAALFRIGSSSALPDIPPNLSLQAKDFLLQCFRREPSTRPTASELLEHPWVTQNTDLCSPTISSVMDTKQLEFEHESNNTPHIHVIEAPVPAPMPKNPKQSQIGDGERSTGTPSGPSNTFVDKGSSPQAKDVPISAPPQLPQQPHNATLPPTESSYDEAEFGDILDFMNQKSQPDA